MDIVAIKASFESMALSGCAGVAVLIGMAGLGAVAYKSPGKILEVARKRGWLYVIVMGVFVAVATDAGSPTQEDKERDRMMRRQQAAEDAAWGVALGIGGLDAMDAEHRRLDATLAGTGPSGGRSEGGPEGALSASPETVDAAEGAVLPFVRPLTDSDYAAGITLARIGTNEGWDFSAPAGAEICTDWLEFGAEKDWFKTQFTNSWSFAFGTNTVDTMTVYSHGLSRPVATNAASFFAPMRATLGVVRAANWEQLAETDRPSQYWQFLSPSNTLVMTWQNVLLDRASDRPVSFQMEFWENGDVMFRYDLSRLAEDVVTNLVVGISNAGEGRVFTALAKDTTSLRWVHLNPARPFDEDPDHDGVPTADEIFMHGTDPYSADTDMDGLSDGQEVNVTRSDPLDPHSIDPRYPDGVASVIGDVDPFSCPEGSTNTVWEHVFYTGTTNLPFAYPQSTDGAAVLRVAVGGSGSGELIVGDRVVPLLGMPSAPARASARSGSEPARNAHELMLHVGRGVVRRAIYRGTSDLALDFSSDDFCIGVRPNGRVPVGWFAFPNTKASEPCIHDLNARRVSVSLDPGPEIEGLTCTWEGGDGSLRVENRPPLSALLTGTFPRDAERQVSFRLDHPHELFGRKVHLQTARFCPANVPGEPDDPCPVMGEGGHSSTEESDPSEPPALECWCWSDCGGCDCPCHWNSDVQYAPVDPEVCELHGMPYELCEPLHAADYHSATNSQPQLPDVLKLHRPLHAQDHAYIPVDVPDGWVPCCGCPDHWTNYVSVAYKSHRIAVRLDGEPFDRTVRDGTLDVFGVLPSARFEDATLGLCMTGRLYETHSYTVLGVGIRHSEIDLDRLNGINRDFGLPTTVQTNLEHALRLKLRTDVGLPSGDIHLALEDATARMQLWMLERDGNYHLMLDTAGKSTLDMPWGRWKKLVSYATSDRETEVRLLTFGEGRAKLFFGYAGSNGVAYVHDEAAQNITVIKPPLLPDYNRDGVVDGIDEDLYLAGRNFSFWTNEDVWRGDDAFAGVDRNFRPPVLPTNGVDRIVNGRNDLVNFAPFALSVHKLLEAWGEGVDFRVACSWSTRPVQYGLLPVEWKKAGEFRVEDKKTPSGISFHVSELEVGSMPEDNFEASSFIPPSFARLGASYKGIVAVEFPAPTEWVGVSATDASTGACLYRFRLPTKVDSVHKMYRWINLHNDNGGFPTRNPSPTLWTDVERDSHSDAMTVFVHGYNVAIPEAWDWSATVYKRLWVCGMDAGFTAVAWPGNDGQFWFPYEGYCTPDYYCNALNAFTNSARFAAVCNALPGRNKFYIAHSLGNMIVSAAAEDQALAYNQYYMLNAAVPIEAYDMSTNTVAEVMTPNKWKPYDRRLRPTGWYDLFPSGDGRRTLTWKGRFSHVVNTVNYYSSEEEVLNNGNGDWYNPLRRNLVWYNQEYRKGSLVAASHNEGGWEFNPYHYVRRNTNAPAMSGSSYYYSRRRPNETTGLDNPSIMTNSFFGPFEGRAVYDSQDGSVATNYAYRAMLLTHAIPSESFAVGGNPVPCWGTNSVRRASLRNVDVASFSRGKADLVDKKAKRWGHSYFVSRSLKRTFELYDDIVKRINKEVEKSNE